jgi:hypothetical protein
VLAWLISAAMALTGLMTTLVIGGVRRFSWGFYPASRSGAAIVVIPR